MKIAAAKHTTTDATEATNMADVPRCRGNRTTTRCIAALCLIVAACIVTTVPVRATPGQRLTEFHAWAAQRTLLRGLVRTTDELSGRPAFDLLTADHGIAWHFHATTGAGRIESEYLGIGSGGGDPGSTPIRHDGSGYGLIFLRSLYGTAIAADFLASSRIASITDRESHVVTTFYRGQRFGYEAASGFLTIATLPHMARDLAQLRTCAAHPGSCNE